MLKDNAAKILEQLNEDDIVLDIGGWIMPFNGANYVVDIMPYETRGEFGSIGGDKEYFTKDTWIQRDICSREPFPFRDKEIDYVICSHTLEDVRDPIFVCSEINRIGKRGYIEVPSRIAETALGVQSRHYAGYCHHRWLIEINDNEIIFFPKLHLVYASWRYLLPSVIGANLRERERIQYMFWDENFSYREKICIGSDEISGYLEEFVKELGVYSPHRYEIDRILGQLLKQSFMGKFYRRIRRSILSLKVRRFENGWRGKGIGVNCSQKMR